MSTELTPIEKERLEKLGAKLKNICNCEMASTKGHMIMNDIQFHLKQAAAQLEFSLMQEEEDQVAVTII